MIRVYEFYGLNHLQIEPEKYVKIEKQMIEILTECFKNMEIPKDTTTLTDLILDAIYDSVYSGLTGLYYINIFANLVSISDGAKFLVRLIHHNCPMIYDFYWYED